MINILILRSYLLNSHNFNIIPFPRLVVIVLLANLLINNASSLEEKALTIQKGESLYQLMIKDGIDRASLNKFIKNIKLKINLNKLQIGQRIILFKDNKSKLRAILIKRNKEMALITYFDKENKITSKNIKYIEYKKYLEEKVHDEEEFAIDNWSDKEIVRLIKSNENLIDVLIRLGAAKEEANKASLELDKQIELRFLQKGDTVKVKFKYEQELKKLDSVAVLAHIGNAHVSRDDFGVFRDASIAESLGSNKNDNIEKPELGDKKLTVLTEVLRGAGFSFLEAKKAASAFASVYPPERLGEDSQIIMPPLGKDIKIFAVDLDGKEAVLLSRNKDGSFSVSITNSNEANRYVVEGASGIANIESLKITTEDHSLEEGENDSEIIKTKIDKGSTLIESLMQSGDKLKNIRKAAQAFSSLYNPSKIKENSNLTIIVQDDLLMGFYVQTYSKACILVYRSGGGYLVEKETIKE